MQFYASALLGMESRERGREREDRADLICLLDSSSEKMNDLHDLAFVMQHWCENDRVESSTKCSAVTE